MDRQPRTLLLAPVLGGQLGGLACACLGAEQDGVEVRPQPLERNPGRMRLAFATRCEATLGVGASAVGLRVAVTQQPELAGHTDCTLTDRSRDPVSKRSPDRNGPTEACSVE